MKKRRSLLRLFNTQKSHAKQRKIEFLLTFSQWLNIWENSGKLEQRGRRSYEYCMARHGDLGPYKIGNVKIITTTQNAFEGSVGRTHSAATKYKIGCGNRGKPSPLRGIPRTEDVKIRIGLAHKGKKKRPKTEDEKHRISIALKGRPSKRKGRTFNKMHSISVTQVQAVRALHAKGLFWRVIAKRLKISRHAVWRALKEQDYGNDSR